MKQYQCQICGYIYDPAQGDPDNHVPPNTPFDKLPPEWVCPICGASQDQFQPGGLGPLPRGGRSIAACPTKKLNYAIHDPQIP